MIRVSDHILISEGDIIYRFSRSAGPGGQNVNKLNTRVTLLFNLARCRGLTNEQKQMIQERLSSRVSGEGVISVVSQRYRTQRANRLATRERFIELLRNALKETPVRKPTTVPYASKRDRLSRKRRRSEVKLLRKPVTFD
ncbi:MAG: aminoacyl-tRNA hydrolase [Sedimentisphaerales bacterium]|nr:aminoacyl-tRNA hydrolase [Sedimentisphaerales bacterium]